MKCDTVGGPAVTSKDPLYEFDCWAAFGLGLLGRVHVDLVGITNLIEKSEL